METKIKTAVEQFGDIVSSCKEIFIQKMKDYGTAWTNLRQKSLTDQIFVKAKRIRTIEEKGVQKVSDSIEKEYIGILNYCVIALIQRKRGSYEYVELNHKKVKDQYDKELKTTRSLLIEKNHDYEEAWRDMRIESITDLILQKLLRVRNIEEQGEENISSEGIDANYRDIANFCIFALIKLKEKM